jgi:hypothetical protein
MCVYAWALFASVRFLFMYMLMLFVFCILAYFCCVSMYVAHGCRRSSRCTYIYAYIYICMYVYIYIYIYMNAHTSVCIDNLFVDKYAYMHPRIHACA